MKYLLLFLILLSSSLANIATVSALKGDARIERGNKNIIAKVGSKLLEKDIIHTERNAKVQLIFKDDTIVTLGKNSALNIETYLYDTKNPKNSKTNLNFFKGAFKTITGKIGKVNREKFKLKTKSASIGIRGTIILGNQDIIACTQGGISVESLGTGTKVEVNANELTTVQENGDLSVPEEYTQDTLNELSANLEPEEESTQTNDEESTSDSNSTSKSEESEESEESGDDDPNNEEQSESNENESSESSENESLESDENESLTSDENQEDETLNNESSDEQVSSDTTNNSENSSDESIDESSMSESDNLSISNENILDESDEINQVDDITSTAEKVTEDSNETEVEQPRVSFNLVGRSLGAYYDSGSFSNSFNHQDNTNAAGVVGVFRATRIDDKIKINERFSRLASDSSREFINKKANKEFSSLGTPKTGGYTGHSDITSTNDLSFSYTRNNSTISGNYKIEVDNMGEVFILYYDGEAFDVSGGTAEYNELIVFGKKGSVFKQERKKIYVYKDFINMSFKKDSDGKYTESSLDKNTDAGFEYYNGKLKSFTHLNKDFHSSGAEEFILGSNKEVKSYRNKYNFNYKSSLNLSSYISGSTEGSIKFLGSDIQTINYLLSSNENKKDYSASTATTTATSSKTNGASFLLSDQIKDAKTTGTVNLSGFINADAYGKDTSNTTLRKSSSNLTLTIDRASGDISGSASIDSGTTPENKITMAFSGDISNNTSYYINDDIFGLMADKDNSNYKVENNEYSLDDNTAYLIAVPDGAFIDNEFKLFDSDDNPLTSDDDASWGYWTAKFSKSSLNNNEYFVSPFSTWVSGIQVSTAIMDGVLDASSNTRYSFEGAVIGTVLNGTSGNLETIITDGSAVNSVKMNFDLGGGTNSLTSSTMNFSSSNTQWNMNMNNAEISNTGFTSSLSGTNITGSLEGKFYGSGSIKSVGGSFNSSLDATSTTENGVTTIHKAQGVFKAVKK